MNAGHILGDEVTSDDDIPMPTNTRPGDISVEGALLYTVFCIYLTPS